VDSTVNVGTIANNTFDNFSTNVSNSSTSVLVSGPVGTSSGSWTPTLNSFTTVGTVTATGTYYKTGKSVTVTVTIGPNAASTVTSTGGTSNITGLPFPVQNGYFAGSLVTSNAASLGSCVVYSGTPNIQTPSFGPFTLTGLAIVITVTYISTTS
jgi:hypothetical protein